MYRSATLFFLAAAGVGIFLANRSHKTVEAHPPAPPDLPIVAVAKAARADLSNRLVLTAEFKPYQEVDVMAKVAGYIKQIKVDIGDRVRRGDLLATLEVPEMGDELRRDQASVERSQANVEQARDDLARAQSAYDMANLTYSRYAAVAKQRPGLLAQQEIDDVHTKALTAAAQVSAAKSAIAAAQQQVEANQAETQKTRTMIDYTRVTAPFTGVITKRYADTGSMIQAGTASSSQTMPVVRLSQNDLLRLILPVPESAVPTVHIGQDVEVNVPTLHRTFPGRVVRFEDKLNLSTRTMNTEVDVPNPSLLLVPGMYAEVDLTLHQHEGVLAIPLTAVDADSANPKTGQVMVVEPDGSVEQRKVTLGIQNADRVEIHSGLRAGDLVVIAGRDELEAGEHVRPKLTQLGAGAAPSEAS